MATSSALRVASALSTRSNSCQAAVEAAQQALAPLSDTPDLALAFVSSHHVARFDEVVDAIESATGARNLLAATGESIAGHREIEAEPALAVWLARLPDVAISTMYLDFQTTPEGASFVGWPLDLPDAWPRPSTLLLLADPFSFPADALLARLNDDQPGLVVLGGMASGGSAPEDNRLALGNRSYRRGAVAALLHGAVQIQPVVSQGCRPIGRPLVVTSAQQNVIRELGGRPALEQLSEIYASLEADDQALVQQGLHLGRVVNEYQDHFAAGDFLVRNCLGVDRQSGAIAVGDFFRVGQTVQFHVRDAATADHDLRTLLAAARDAAGPAAGALLFTCNGRGTRMFGQPHHDVSVVAEVLGEVPLAGFFAQGEIGPVGGKNFVHGFTASLALFRAAGPPARRA